MDLLRLGLLDRDFDERDYEMLLALDKDLPNRGASERDIHQLPEHVLETKANETCCICLEDMEAGEKVKRLRCSHAFHSGCIDQWLKINKVCPIDKTEIVPEA